MNGVKMKDYNLKLLKAKGLSTYLKLMQYVDSPHWWKFPVVVKISFLKSFWNNIKYYEYIWNPINKK